MSNEAAKPNLKPWIDPDLEARIVALVLGEASDFEGEQLERIIGERRELQIFRRYIQSAHDQLTEIGSGKFEEVPGDEDDAAWRLSDERRATVLEALGKPSPKPKEIVAVTPPNSRREKRRWRRDLVWGWIAAAAAAAIAVLCSLFGPVGHQAMKSAAPPEIYAMTVDSSADYDMERAEIFGGQAPDSDNRSKPEPAPAPAPFVAAPAPAGEPAPTPSEPESLRRPAALALDGTISAGRQQLLGEELLAESNGDSPRVARYFSTAGQPDRPAGSGPESEPQLQLQRGFSNGGMAGGGGAVADPRAAPGQGSASGDAFAPDPAQPSPRGIDDGLGNGRDAGAAGAKRDVADKSKHVSGDRFGAMFDEAEVESTELADLQTIPEALKLTKEKLQAVPAQADVNRSGPISDGSMPSAGAAGGDFEELSAATESSIQDGRKAQAASEEADRQQSQFSSAEGNAELPELQSLESRYSLYTNGQAIPADFGLAIRQLAEVRFPEIMAAVEPFSTFSLHVSDVSFKLAQASLANGEWPEPDKIRIEEFVNAFDYGDPMPGSAEKIACQQEQTIHPFLQQRNLLRVSMRTAEAGRSSQTPLRLTLLLDNSGSMERADRRGSVLSAFLLLAQQLQAQDQVTLIGFARQPRLLADRVNGQEAQKLAYLVANTPSEGGTNLEAALNLAFAKAREQKLEGAQNRIVLLTDGAANLGDAAPERLSAFVERMRSSGIAFDAAGVGADGLNDEILEALTRKGDGRYYFLNQASDADNGFAKQIAGALRPAAMNVKVQVEFNRDRVGRYKLLGYEKHRLNTEDFRDDTVDAAEMAAAEAGVAVYQFEPLPNGSGDIGSVSVRFRDMSTNRMVEKRWPIPYQAAAPRIEDAHPAVRIASVAALFAAKLKGDPVGEAADLGELVRILSGLPERQRNDARVQQLLAMIEQAKNIQR